MFNFAEEEATGRIGHDVPPPCKFCGAKFHDIDAMRDHKRAKLQEESEAGSPSHMHLWCDICDLDFHTKAGLSTHRRQFHAKEQDLSCPGCGKHFIRLSDFVQHIELNQCPKLGLTEIMARMHKRMCWVKGLGHIDKMSKGDVITGHEKNYYEYLGHEPVPPEPWWSHDWKPSPWQAQDAGWDQPDCVGPEDDKTPNTARDNCLHGNPRVPDLLTGDTNDQPRGNNNENAWVKSENLFPNAPVSKQPTSEQWLGLEGKQRAAEQHVPGTKLDLADPHSPRFSADRFWNQYVRKYKCPHDFCNKSFARKSALVQHLCSLAHRGAKISCPSCFRSFGALYSLAAHVESQSQRCHMRHNKAFGWFLNQLTWGTAEVAGTHGDNTHKYQLQKDFVDYCSPKKTTGPTYGQEQAGGPQEDDRSATSDKHTPLTAGALAKLQEEMMSSGMQSTPYTARRQRQQSSSGDGDGDGDGDGVGAGDAVPLTAEALSRLHKQDNPTGTGTWFQTPGVTWDTPSGNSWDQSPELPVEQQQQQQADDFWGGSWQPEQKQQQDDWGWHQSHDSSYSQEEGHATQKGGYYMW